MGARVLTQLTTPAIEALRRVFTADPTPAPTTGGGGNIGQIINGIAPDWGPFGQVGQQAKVLIEVIMAAAILICLSHTSG